MKIVIKRYRKKNETIDGQLYIDGQQICDTAENAHHCLPTGEYPITIHKCKQHARKMPIAILHKDMLPPCEHCAEMECVSNNTKMPTICHQIKAGNGVYHRTDGTILVGKYLAPGCLSHPKTAFDALYERIRKNIERGNPVTIIISNV